MWVSCNGVDDAPQRNVCHLIEAHCTGHIPRCVSSVQMVEEVGVEEETSLVEMERVRDGIGEDVIG